MAAEDANLTHYIFEMVRVFGAWILVILGWLVVADQQDFREQAKNCTARFLQLREQLIKIEDLAIKHHTTIFEQTLVNEIIRSVGDLSYEISYLHTCGLVGAGVSNNMMEFRQSITSRNMDFSTYATKELNSELVLNIRNKRSSLDRDLMSSAHLSLSTPRRFRDSIKNVLLRRI